MKAVALCRFVWGLLACSLAVFALPTGAQPQGALPPGVGLSHRPGLYARITETTAEGSVTYLERMTLTRSREVLDHTERGMGEFDLRRVDADLDPRYRGVVDAVGWVLPMGCTATHLGKGYVLTAQHCFSFKPVRGVANQPCKDVTIRWGHREGATPLVSRCEVILAGEFSDDKDFALLRVSPAPAAKVELNASERPAPGTRLTLFSHPQGRPLEWSGTCKLHGRMDGGFTARFMFAHQCDTEPGSGGAALLDDETLKVVGVHGGGEITEFTGPQQFTGWNFATYLADLPLPKELLLPEGKAQERQPSRPSGK